MNSTQKLNMTNRRQFLSTSTAFALGAMFASRPSQCLATSGNVIRVEEDWEIKIETAVPDRNTPEMVTSIGPVADDSEAVVSLLINHATYPSYNSGGVQLQVWRNDQLLGISNFAQSKQLATANEVIRFTLVMALEGGKLRYQVIDGTSSTFGTFAGDGIDASTSLTSLSGYSPKDSIRRSVVSVGGNRLAKYQINQIRYSTEGSTEVLIDKTIHSVLKS